MVAVGSNKNIFSGVPLADALLSLPTDSVLGKYLSEHGIDNSLLYVNPEAIVGDFNDLVAIRVRSNSENEEESNVPAAKRGKPSHYDLDTTVISEHGLTDKKALFFPADQTVS